MFCVLNMLFYHPVSEATPDSKITGAYCSPVMAVRTFPARSFQYQRGVHGPLLARHGGTSFPCSLVPLSTREESTALCSPVMAVCTFPARLFLSGGYKDVVCLC
jgi:hypothetical protein